MGEVKRAQKQGCFSRSKYLYHFHMKYIEMLMFNCAAVEKHVSTAEFRFMWAFGFSKRPCGNLHKCDGKVARREKIKQKIEKRY
jgi:hypothetical protein